MGKEECLSNRAICHTSRATEEKRMNERKQILKANEIFSYCLSDPVRIRPVELNKFPPQSVPTMFDKTCKQFPNRPALNFKKNGVWEKMTYWEYRTLVRCCAKGFIKLGLLPNTVVCIIGFNSPEWFISDLGAIYAGGIAAGIYATNSPEACLYCLNHSNAKILVMENTQASKILQIKNQAKSVKAIIQYGGQPSGPDILPWEMFMKIGEAVPDSLLDKARRSINVNQCCTLVYTSGTMGNPKGAMLSHDNVVYDAMKIGEKIGLTKKPQEVYVSYLPLSHVAGNIVDIHCCFIFAIQVCFADKDALRGSLVSTFQEVKPTRILSVPRVWEKIFEKLQEKATELKGFKKALSAWSKKQGLMKSLAQEKNAPYSYLYYLANMIVFRKVKKILGIERCRTIISGAAPLSTDIKLYFASLDILILEGFGMSESSALHSCCIPESFRFDSCGTACNGMTTFIVNPDEDGNGELCLFGRHIFMGYLNDKEKTLEAIDDHGFLRSGDIARIDEDGFIYITGRLKELIITAGGENVAPVLIEQNIKTALPFIGHAVVIGDRRKFLIVLLTLATEVNDNQEPTNVLAAKVRTWLSRLGFNYATISEVIESGPDRKIVDSIQEGINEANDRAISNAQKVQKFVLLPQDFSIFTGELGPTMKIKRKVISDKYQSIIDKVYEEAVSTNQ